MNKPFAAISPSSAFAVPAPQLQRTHGDAAISFKVLAGRTRLDRLRQAGAAKIRLPKQEAASVPLAVLINTAGGLTGGDRMSYAVTLPSGARAAVTTQACEKIYRSAGEDAEVSTRIDIAAEARLDWLPQETILFDGARLSRRLDVNLDARSSLLAVEATLFGRAARGERITSGLFRDRWRIRRGGKLVFADNLCFDWTDPELLQRPAVLRGGGAMATILYLGPDAENFLEPVRAAVGGHGGVSVWNGKLLARIVAEGGAALRRVINPALVELLDGAALPKLWQI